MKKEGLLETTMKILQEGKTKSKNENDLAWELVDYAELIDQYDFNDQYDSEEEAYEDIAKSLNTKEGQQSIISELQNDIIESNNEEAISKAKELLKQVQNLSSSKKQEEIIRDSEVEDEFEDAKYSYAFEQENKDDIWVSGTILPKGNTTDSVNYLYTFEAKVYIDPSDFGIENGQVSKLFVTYIPDVTKDNSKTIASYERGWDIKPKTKEDKDLVEHLVKALERFRKKHPYTTEKDLEENKKVESIDNEIKNLYNEIYDAYIDTYNRFTDYYNNYIINVKSYKEEKQLQQQLKRSVKEAQTTLKKDFKSKCGDKYTIEFEDVPLESGGGFPILINKQTGETIDYTKVEENKKVEREEKTMENKMLSGDEYYVAKNSYGYNVLGLIVDNTTNQYQIVSGQTIPSSKVDKKVSRKEIREKAEHLKEIGYKEYKGYGSVSESKKVENAEPQTILEKAFEEETKYWLNDLIDENPTDKIAKKAKEALKPDNLNKIVDELVNGSDELWEDIHLRIEELAGIDYRTGIEESKKN